MAFYQLKLTGYLVGWRWSFRFRDFFSEGRADLDRCRLSDVHHQAVLVQVWKAGAIVRKLFNLG